MSSRPLPEFPYGHSRNIPIIAMAGEELSHPVTRKQTTRPFETDVYSMSHYHNRPGCVCCDRSRNIQATKIQSKAIYS